MEQPAVTLTEDGAHWVVRALGREVGRSTDYLAALLAAKELGYKNPPLSPEESRRYWRSVSGGA